MRIRRPNVYVLGVVVLVATLGTLAALVVQTPAFTLRNIEPAGPCTLPYSSFTYFIIVSVA